MTTQLTDRYAEALAYATEIHSSQVRKGPGGIPYISHLLAASSLVIEVGGTEDEAIAALLHDAAEDQGGERRLADIEAHFGPDVAGIVRECSDSLAEDPESKAPWRERKQAHLQHLRQATASAVVVTAADKVHNARSLVSDLRHEGHSYLRNFNASASDILWYYREMYRTLLSAGAPPRLTAELGLCLLDLDEAISATRRPLLRTVLGDWIRLQPEGLFDDEPTTLGLDEWRSIVEEGSDRALTKARAVTALEAVRLSGLPIQTEVWVRGEHWQATAVTPATQTLVLAMRSDGTWVEFDGYKGGWDGLKEGGPEALGMYVAREFSRSSRDGEMPSQRYGGGLMRSPRRRVRPRAQ